MFNGIDGAYDLFHGNHSAVGIVAVNFTFYLHITLETEK